MLQLQTQGFEEAAQLLANVDVAGQLGRGIGSLVGPLSRFAATITPVVTGAMRDAWTDRAQGMTGSVFISPAATNPRTGAPVTDYAGIVSDRLGIMGATMVEGGRLAVEMLEGIEWLPGR